jgi:hypothetical protein
MSTVLNWLRWAFGPALAPATMLLLATSSFGQVTLGSPIPVNPGDSRAVVAFLPSYAEVPAPVCTCPGCGCPAKPAARVVVPPVKVSVVVAPDHAAVNYTKASFVEKIKFRVTTFTKPALLKYLDSKLWAGGTSSGTLLVRPSVFQYVETPK